MHWHCVRTCTQKFCVQTHLIWILRLNEHGWTPELLTQHPSLVTGWGQNFGSWAQHQCVILWHACDCFLTCTCMCMGTFPPFLPWYSSKSRYSPSGSPPDGRWADAGNGWELSLNQATPGPKYLQGTLQRYSKVPEGTNVPPSYPSKVLQGITKYF